MQVTNGQSFTLRYAYTRAGQLAAMQYPDGMTVDYVRDGQGRTTEIGATPVGGIRQVLLSGATYHPFGPVAGWTFGNGRMLTRSLDLDYRPQRIQSQGIGAGGLDIGYGWDAVGNLTSLYTADLAQPARITVTYDALNRLTAFRDGPTGAAIESYTYDATGNRASLTNASGIQAYTYPADSHRLTAIDGFARLFDASGNTTAIGISKEFAYNAANRLSMVKQGGAVTMTYAYTGRGERVRQYQGASSVTSLYDEHGQWLGDYDEVGAAKQQAIWLDGLPVGLLATQSAQRVPDVPPYQPPFPWVTCATAAWIAQVAIVAIVACGMDPPPRLNKDFVLAPTNWANSPHHRSQRRDVMQFPMTPAGVVPARVHNLKLPPSRSSRFKTWICARIDRAPGPVHAIWGPVILLSSDRCWQCGQDDDVDEP